jgi:hypothetical protein
VKYGSARNCRQQFRHKFCEERVPRWQIIYNFVSKLWVTGFLINENQKHKCQVFTWEKLVDTGARFKHTPRKSLKCLARGTEVSKSTAKMATQWLMFGPYKTTAIHAHLAAAWSSWKNSFLQSAIEGEINVQLTLFSDEDWFHLQGYINMQNNCYWSSQNPHLTHKFLLHPMKVVVWCAVSARRIVVPGSFKETINCERYLCVEGWHFQHLLWSVNCNYFIKNVIGHQSGWFIDKICMHLVASGTPSRHETSQQSKNSLCIIITLEKSVYKHQVVSIMVKYPISLSTYSRERSQAWL